MSNKDKRPWGYFEVIAENGSYKIKKIVVHPNKRLSYQSHQHRHENWTIMKGNALVTINGRELLIVKNDGIVVRAGDKHRIFNPSHEKDLVIIEVQTGSYFGEDDITRYEDDYKRI